MPNLVFLLFTAGLLGLAWWIRGREQKAPAEPKPVKMAENNSVVEATWNDVQPGRFSGNGKWGIG